MGRCQDSSKGDAPASGRRLGWRICLRKGCGRKYRAQQWNQRYCREPECLKEVRRWQAKKRQRRRRAAPEGRKSHAEAERARRQRSARPSKPLSRDNASTATTVVSGAWSRSKTPLCDRPGCYEPPRDSRRAPSAYCSDACRACVRRVKDRERKWLARNTKAGQRKRRLEYHAAAKKQLPLPGASSDAPRSGREPAGGRARTAVGGYRWGDEARVPLPQSGSRSSPGVASHDSQTGVDGRPRAPPAPQRLVVD